MTTIDYLLSQLMDDEKLLTAINDKSNKKADIAKLYAECIAKDNIYDWGNVNRAIIARWHRWGLDRIKKIAWKSLEDGSR